MSLSGGKFRGILNEIVMPPIEGAFLAMLGRNPYGFEGLIYRRFEEGIASSTRVEK